MMHRTIVRCDVPGCGEPATHKIASPWSDGRFSELKTYGFSCAEHVGDVCRSAEVRWLDYEPVKGESVGSLRIYRYESGKGDRNLEPDPEMEEAFLT